MPHEDARYIAAMNLHNLHVDHHLPLAVECQGWLSSGQSRSPSPCKEWWRTNLRTRRQDIALVTPVSEPHFANYHKSRRISPGPLAFLEYSRPSLRITARSYSLTSCRKGTRTQTGAKFNIPASYFHHNVHAYEDARTINGTQHIASLTLIVHNKDNGKNKIMSSMEKAAST